MRPIALRLLLLLFFSFHTAGVFAEDPYWLLLEQGKRLFRDGLYGDAMLRFEDAIRTRRGLFERNEQSLIDTLSMPDVRRLGDDLTAVEAHIDSHKLHAARTALDTLYSAVEKDSLANSAQKALAALKTMKAYPEGEFWLGEVFRIEGETAIALSQYQKALDAQSVMEIPDEARTIRYRMAALHAARREYKAMEAQLLKIVSEDQLWSDQKRNFVRESMTRTLSSEGIDRFLILYRHASYATYEAQKDLGVYYYRTGRHDRAYSHLLFAFLIGATALIDELRAEDHEYVFGSFTSLLAGAQARDATKEYLKNSEYYKTLYYLAAALYANGHRKPAAEIWRLTADVSASGEWGRRASRQLASPYVEPSTETP